MDWLKERLKQHMERGDKNFAMAAALGAYSMATKLHDLKLLEEITQIVEEVIFNEKE